MFSYSYIGGLDYSISQREWLGTLFIRFRKHWTGFKKKNTQTLVRWAGIGIGLKTWKKRADTASLICMVTFNQAVAQIKTGHKVNFIKLNADWYRFNLNYSEWYRTIRPSVLELRYRNTTVTSPHNEYSIVPPNKTQKFPTKELTLAKKKVDLIHANVFM